MTPAASTLQARLAETWSRLADAWHSWLRLRTSRERLILLAGAIVVGAAVFLVLVRQPLGEAREAALSRIDLLERVKGQISILDPAAAHSVAAAPAVPPATAITSAASSFGLTIRRLESRGAATSVSVDDVKFDTLILWLDELDRNAGLRLTSAEMERRPEPGVVSARLAFEP